MTFIDSTGIGFLLARYNQVQSYQGELILKNISPAIRRLFALVGDLSDHAGWKRRTIEKRYMYEPDDIEL